MKWNRRNVRVIFAMFNGQIWHWHCFSSTELKKSGNSVIFCLIWMIFRVLKMTRESPLNCPKRPLTKTTLRTPRRISSIVFQVLNSENWTNSKKITESAWFFASCELSEAKFELQSTSILSNYLVWFSQGRRSIFSGLFCQCKTQAW